MLEQKNKGRAKVKVAVFSVLAVHGVGLLAALLMQGCRREDANTAAQTNNVAPPIFADATNPPAASNAEVAAPIPVPPTNTPVPDTTPVAAGAAQDYKIVAGDNFSTLGKKFGVTAAAITAANPGVEPTKLKIGQTIHIPAPAPVAATTNHTAPAANPASGEVLYTVKSNDTLSKIATQYNVKVSAIRDANGLTTDKIKVGQKLKIPGKVGAPAPVDTNTAH